VQAVRRNWPALRTPAAAEPQARSRRSRNRFSPRSGSISGADLQDDEERAACTIRMLQPRQRLFGLTQRSVDGCSEVGHRPRVITGLVQASEDILCLSQVPGPCVRAAELSEHERGR
jgi:hypothetical protein